MDHHVLLSTAIVSDANGDERTVELLDSGSQSNFVTSDLPQKLKLQQSRMNLPIVGINGASYMVRYSVRIKIWSRFKAFNAIVKCSRSSR